MTEYVVGFTIGVVTVLLGVFFGVGWSVVEFSKTERRRKAIAAQPVCGCRHHYSFHDNNGCHFTHNPEYAHDRYQCGCRKYIGPAIEGDQP